MVSMSLNRVARIGRWPSLGARLFLAQAQFQILLKYAGEMTGGVGIEKDDVGEARDASLGF